VPKTEAHKRKISERMITCRCNTCKACKNRVYKQKERAAKKTRLS
jgi:hypothetical protein